MDAPSELTDRPLRVDFQSFLDNREAVEASNAATKARIEAEPLYRPSLRQGAWPYFESAWPTPFIKNRTQSALRLLAAGDHARHQSGYSGNLGTSSVPYPHEAAESKKIRARGRRDGSSSSDPAGTTSSRPLRV
jgi:hypothetical protein